MFGDLRILEAMLMNAEELATVQPGDCYERWKNEARC